MATSRGSGRTGDMGNNLWKLLREVQRMKLKVEPNIRGLSQGLASAFLPLLHAAFMSYSLPLSQQLAESGVELYGRSDLRFVEGLYKVMRDTLHYRPQLTKDQFLSPGYAERKIIMTFDLLQLCQTKHHQLDGARATHKQKRTVLHCGSSMNHYLASGGHSVQEVAGVSSVWRRDAPENRLVTAESEGFSVSLPPSPPPSPLQTPSPIVVHGCPLLCGAGELELTPCSTPLKYPARPKEDRTATSSQHHTTGVCVQVVREPVLTTSDGSDEDDKEEEMHPVVSHSEMQHTREHQHQSSQEDGKHSNGEERNSSQQLQLDEVCHKLGQLTKLVESMSARLVLLETQMKLLEGAQLRTEHRPVLSRQQPLQATASTQTEETLPTHTPSPSSHLHTSSTPLLAAAGGVAHPSSSPHSPPTSALNRSHTHTPEETKRVIERLRTRAQHTRQLLCRASQADSPHPVH